MQPERANTDTTISLACATPCIDVYSTSKHLNAPTINLSIIFLQLKTSTSTLVLSLASIVAIHTKPDKQDHTNLKKRAKLGQTRTKTTKTYTVSGAHIE